MADTVEHCPDCGNPLSDELGQYSEDLLTGTVTCPHCGATVELPAEPAEPAPAGRSSPDAPGNTTTPEQSDEAAAGARDDPA